MTENETKTGKLLSVFIIAGEASGDALGGKLMKAMRAKSERPLSFHGIGGIRMQAEGLQSLFPMHEIAIMGFAEIVPHIPHMLQRIKQTVETIQR
ncbi:MAG: hypothetical protein KDD76_01175, partial [Rickettsiales bacterium]|nr:hypothetical protein [Rickettsiales bacterium]